MPLMDRIKIKPFLSYTEEEKRKFISDLQLSRTNALKIASMKKRRKKTTKKKTSTKKRNTISKKQKALKALEKLSAEQLKIIMENL